MFVRLKKFIGKYTPGFLKPYLYKLYRCFIDNIYSDNKWDKKIKQLEVYKILHADKVNSVHILQHSFFDLKGENCIYGGAERYLVDLSKIIMDMGLTVFIIQMGDRLWYKKFEGIHVIGLPTLDSLTLNKFAHNPVFGKPKLRIYSPFTLASPHFDKNSIGISHGIYWDRPHTELLMPIIKSSFFNLDTIISVDTATISWFRSTFQHEVLKKTIKYVPNYVNLEIFHPLTLINKNDAIRIIFPRRLCEPRGYFLVASIVKDIINKYNKVEFHFVGHASPGPEMNSINKLVKRFENKVQHYKENAENMHQVYQKADIVLIPTIASEGTSLSCLEAMATGNAIIATNVGGLTDLIINGYNGLLIDPDEKELKVAIERLILDTELRTRLANKALEVSKAFSKKLWEDRWIKILGDKLN